MAKSKKKAEPVAEVKVPLSFEIDGVTYTEGDPLQIIAPELGLIPITSWRFQPYSSKGIVSFDLGWVKTLLPCGGWFDKDGNEHNARIGLTCTRLQAGGSFSGSHYDELHLIYFCQCRHGVHTENFRWRVGLEDSIIRADQIGRDHFGKPHNHPLVDGYEHLVPIPVEPEPPKAPFIIPGTQFKLF